MIRRVEMRAVMRGELDPFDRPAFAVGQLLVLQAREELADLGRGLLVVEVADARPVARRIGGDVVLQRNGDVDQLARHGCHLSCRSCRRRMRAIGDRIDAVRRRLHGHSCAKRGCAISSSPASGPWPRLRLAALDFGVGEIELDLHAVRIEQEELVEALVVDLTLLELDAVLLRGGRSCRAGRWCGNRYGRSRRCRSRLRTAGRRISCGSR